MKRRQWMQGAFAVPVVALARPEPVARRRAVFEEVGDAVLMTISLPMLFRRYDKDALESIDSGFDTTVQYTIKLWEHGTNKVVASHEVLVRVRRDPWKQRYVVSTRTEGRWTKRSFEKRDDAVAATVKLDRVRIAAASELERGEDGPTYFVTVLAQRNPLEPSEDFGASTSAQGRDLEWFGRLVDVLAGERAQAEETVHVRTNPFYLVAR